MSTTQKTPSLHDPRWVRCSDLQPIASDYPLWSRGDEFITTYHTHYTNPKLPYYTSVSWFSEALLNVPIAISAHQPKAPCWIWYDYASPQAKAAGLTVFVWSDRAKDWNYFSCLFSDFGATGGASKTYTHWLPGEEANRPTVEPLQQTLAKWNNQPIDIPTGYRELVSGEMILASDETYWEEKWQSSNNSCHPFGYHGAYYDVSYHCATIRKLAVADACPALQFGNGSYIPRVDAWIWDRDRAVQQVDRVARLQEKLEGAEQDCRNLTEQNGKALCRIEYLDVTIESLGRQLQSLQGENAKLQGKNTELDERNAMQSTSVGYYQEENARLNRELTNCEGLAKFWEKDSSRRAGEQVALRTRVGEQENQLKNALTALLSATQELQKKDETIASFTEQQFKWHSLWAAVGSYLHANTLVSSVRCLCDLKRAFDVCSIQGGSTAASDKTGGV